MFVTDLPEKEGVETIIELRRDFPDVKIIAISGGSRLLNKDVCLDLCRAQGIPTVSKPFERKEILEAIEKLLGNVSVS